LGSVNKVNLSGKLAAPVNKFEIEGHYSLLNNYIYYSDSLPLVYERPINITALTVQKEFVFWKIHSFNKLTYQVSENSSIIEIPSLIFFNSSFIDHTWQFKMTGGSLRTLFGVDVYYTSKFRGYNYIPALSMFYQQGESEFVGNYPFIDVWMNVRLKRTRFFLKYEHANASNDNLHHFYAVNYPSKISAFKFGISWTFYD
jgi:hypothetical protein